MTDLFSERCGDLLTGSYDCVDRIVLNAYFSLGHSPGGFRVWWRRWHGDGDQRLDNAHLMRLAGRFARRVRASAQAHGIPVIDRKAVYTGSIPVVASSKTPANRLALPMPGRLG